MLHIPMKTSHPFLLFCPYLPLNCALEVGPWRLVRLSKFNGSWMNKTFQDWSTQFLHSFQDAFEKTVEDPLLIVHSQKGATGEKPEDNELRALRDALDFAGCTRKLWIFVISLFMDSIETLDQSDHPKRYRHLLISYLELLL